MSRSCEHVIMKRVYDGLPEQVSKTCEMGLDQSGKVVQDTF